MFGLKKKSSIDFLRTLYNCISLQVNEKQILLLGAGKSRKDVYTLDIDKPRLKKTGELKVADAFRGVGCCREIYLLDGMVSTMKHEKW